MTNKRIGIFLLITFLFSWMYEFVIVRGMMMGQFGNLGAASVQLAIAQVMFFPALAVVITRLITKEGFSPVALAPVSMKGTMKWWLLAWFGPSLLILAGVAMYFFIYAEDFDPALTAFTAMIGSTEGVDMGVHQLVLVQVLTAMFAAPLLNFFVCFGEEWGWRGYLLPKMLEDHNIVTTLLVIGVVWGLWHAPLIAMGHNYGFGYWGFPFTGILMMCAVCLVMGIFNSFVTIKSGSCIPAVLAHGAFNGMASVGVIFSLTGGNPFVGPAATGVVGGLGVIIVTLVMITALIKQERAGESFLARFK